MMILGSHVSLGGNDQFLGSVKEALSYQANAFMVYTGAPQNTLRKSITQMKIKEAHELIRSSQIQFEHIIVHAPYIVNLGNPDPEKRNFAVSFLIEEVKRTHELGSKVMVLHPGAHMGDGPELGIQRISEGLQQIIDQTIDYPVTIALESMAGKGTEVGRNFQELAAIIKSTNRSSRIGVCYDTCHTSDAGYYVKTSFDDVLAEFDSVIGLSYLKVLHVNDSKNPQGAMKDRHENIGFGTLGFDVLHSVITHPKLTHIPKILETPYVEDPLKENASYPPYAYEIQMIHQGTFNPKLKEIIVQNRGII
ncbi:MAG: deoxyribonuclease IV [Candidatus Izemoplasmatales bacterium]|nr:deoxyribonuclease IV [Candidatus Izemoplasmatales bacterium]